MFNNSSITTNAILIASPCGSHGLIDPQNQQEMTKVSLSKAHNPKLLHKKWLPLLWVRVCACSLLLMCVH